MRWLILLMMGLVMVGIVNALNVSDMCPSEVPITKNCTMMTPWLNCTHYTYDIYNNTGELLVENESLTLLSNRIYYFNFTQGEGEYIIKLCDDSTKQVKVTGEVGNMYIAVMMGVGFLLAILAYFSFKTDSHPLRALFVSTTLFLLLIPINMGKLMAEAEGASVNFVSMLSASYHIIMWIAIIVLAYLIFFLMVNIFTSYKKKKIRAKGLEFDEQD